MNRILVVAKNDDWAVQAIERLASGANADMFPSSWVDAPQLSASGKYQIVIVQLGGDIGVASATTFARNAARWQNRNSILLVALTDEASTAIHRDLQMSGFDDIIHKPVHKAQIASRISVLLRLSTMRRELTRRQATARGFTNGESLFLAPGQPLSGARRASVLLVQFDSSSESAEQFTRAVRSCTEAQIADDPQTAQSMLYRGGLDAVLLCADADADAAIAFADRMRQIPALYNLPVLLASSDVSALDLDEIFAVGITDVTETSLSSEQLSVHLASFKRLEALRGSLAARFAQHVEMVIRDGVTGMACFGFGMGHLERTLDDCAALDLPLSIASLRLKNLDEINRVYGYRAGDTVLRKLGDTIRRCIRGEDMATRTGGANFLIQFPDTNYGAARVAVQRLSNVLRFQQIDLPDGAGPINVELDYNLTGWDGKADAETLVAGLKKHRLALAA